VQGVPDASAVEDGLAGFGLVAEASAEPERLELWPENLPVVQAFSGMDSQWNVGGMGGIIGLRYEALPAVLRYLGIPRAEQAEVFSGIRIMEREALCVLNAK
jgi:hypothetical protein